MGKERSFYRQSFGQKECYESLKLEGNHSGHVW
jgi:hypothetical protein